MKSFESIIQLMQPISLSEMNKVKLMNRIDTKYITDIETFSKLMELIQQKYYVQEHLGNRIAKYRTLYFDTPNLQFYMQHHNGKSARNKVRVRQYCDSGQFFCEIKKKSNKGRTVKKRIEVGSNDFIDLSYNPNIKTLIEKELLIDCTELFPNLENRFFRITFVNFEKTERLTVDFEVSFINHQNHLENKLQNLVIIELKQEGRSHSDFKQMIYDLPVFEKSFSKYCIGVVVTDPSIKANRFKSKIHFLKNKLQTNFK
ncbi:MAG: polyphosphate polymerase protein [Bacteroidetes bacterium]|nr:polyphosphate polymerase protein [Bacteroidota bacterium]